MDPQNSVTVSREANQEKNEQRAILEMLLREIQFVHCADAKEWWEFWDAQEAQGLEPRRTMCEDCKFCDLDYDAPDEPRRICTKYKIYISGFDSCKNAVNNGLMQKLFENLKPEDVED